MVGVRHCAHRTEPPGYTLSPGAASSSSMTTFSVPPQLEHSNVCSRYFEDLRSSIILSPSTFYRALVRLIYSKPGLYCSHGANSTRLCNQLFPLPFTYLLVRTVYPVCENCATRVIRKKAPCVPTAVKGTVSRGLLCSYGLMCVVLPLQC